MNQGNFLPVDFIVHELWGNAYSIVYITSYFVGGGNGVSDLNFPRINPVTPDFILDDISVLLSAGGNHVL
jgi:hypothetical protein